MIGSHRAMVLISKYEVSRCYAYGLKVGRKTHRVKITVLCVVMKVVVIDLILVE